MPTGPTYVFHRPFPYSCAIQVDCWDAGCRGDQVYGRIHGLGRGGDSQAPGFYTKDSDVAGHKHAHRGCGPALPCPPRHAVGQKTFWMLPPDAWLASTAGGGGVRDKSRR